MKVVTVVGARPQFIKAASVSRVLRVHHHEVLVHTGQHYDPQLSDIFFRELAMPAPDVQLHVGSGRHAAQTARMLEAIEQVLLAEQPDAVLVYGDTNSTLAGALAACKLAVPVVHVEAGLRSFNREMPEEINRVLTDHMSTLLCCPSARAVAQLAAEGITRGVVLVGDVMLDALHAALGGASSERAMPTDLPGTRQPYVLATLHRASNTDDPARLAAVLAAFARIREPLRWPMHPRTRHAVANAGLSIPANVTVLEPLGYAALVRQLHGARAVITDSGGLQKEAYWLGVPCLTLRNETEWTETVEAGWNRLVDPLADDLRVALQHVTHPMGARDAYGTIGAGERVVQAMEQLLGARRQPTAPADRAVA